jgi:hypothetical protein
LVFVHAHTNVSGTVVVNGTSEYVKFPEKFSITTFLPTVVVVVGSVVVVVVGAVAKI